MKDHSFTEYYMESYKEDWTQNSNNDRNVSCGELSNNLRRCLLCSKLFDSLSLLKHNLIHLHVNLEILPDEIFQFYEQGTTRFEINEKPDIFEINQQSNTVISDIKPEIEEIQSENSNYHFFDEANSSMEYTMKRNTKNIVSKTMIEVDPETTSFEIYEDPDISEINQHSTTAISDIKYEIEEIQSDNSNDHFFDEANSSMEYTMKRNTKNIVSKTMIEVDPETTSFEIHEDPDISEINQHSNTAISDTKYEIVEIQSDNSSDHFSDVKTPNKDTEDNSSMEFTMKRNWENIINEIKFEVDSANNTDQLLDLKQLNKNKEQNRNVQHFVSNINKFEVEENSVDMIFDVQESKEGIEHHNNIEQQQRCHNTVVKREIEEICSESTSNQVLDIENSKVDKEHNNNIDSEIHAIVKCKIEVIDLENVDDQLIDEVITNYETETTKDIDIAKAKNQNPVDSTQTKYEIYTHTNNTKKVKKSNKDVEKPKKKPRQCHICKKLISYKHLGQHIKQIHTRNEVNCEVCKKTFKNEKNMRAHFKNIHERSTFCREEKIYKKLTFRCDHCRNTFTSKDCLQKHIKSVHGNAVQCYICGSRLASEIYLKPHIKRVHYDDGEVHSCDLCEKIFKSPRYLRVHMKNSHTVSSKKKTKKKDM